MNDMPSTTVDPKYSYILLFKIYGAYPRIWEYRESKVDAMVGMNTFLKSLDFVEPPHFIDRMRAVLSKKYETTAISAWIEKVPQSRLVPYVFEPNF